MINNWFKDATNWVKSAHDFGQSLWAKFNLLKNQNIFILHVKQMIQLKQ